MDRDAAYVVAAGFFVMHVCHGDKSERFRQKKRVGQSRFFSGNTCETGYGLPGLKK